MSVARISLPRGSQVDDLIDEAESCLVHDREHSRELITRAEAALAGQRDPVRMARIGRVLGDLAVARGQLGAATAAYRTARRHWLAADEVVEALWATDGAIEAQLLMGEVDTAETGLLRLRDEVARVSRPDVHLVRLAAVVQRQLADVCASRGRISSALRQYDAAENLFASVGDANGSAQVQVRRSVALLDAGLAHNALLELKRARTGFRAVDAPDGVLVSSVLAAAALAAIGQVSRALEALDQLAPAPAATGWHVGYHALARADALLRAGFPAEAHGAGCIAEQVFMEMGSVDLAARASLACARASLARGRHRVAEAELATADRLFDDCGSRLMQLQTWLVRAQLAWLTGDPAACLALCDRVVAVGGDDLPACLAVRERVLRARVVDDAEAGALLDDAGARASAAGLPRLRAEVLLAQARRERRTGRLTRAIESTRTVLEVALSEEQRFAGRDDVASPFRLEVTEQLVRLLLERGDHAARVEALRLVRAAKAVRISPPVVDPPVAADAEQRLEVLLASAIAPFGLAAGTGEPLPPAPLGPLVEYYLAGDDVVVFVVRDGHVDARLLERAGQESRRLVDAWQQECMLMAPGHHAGLTSSPALDGLFDLLLAPVLDLLHDLDDELAVVGHRHLHGVPFDALLDEVGPWGVALTRVGFLDEPAAPASASASAPAPGMVAALVLAVADEAAPSITDEAEMIRDVLGTADVLLGEEATTAALAGRAAGADVVHFACHGVFRPDDPLSSGLRLADGWLSARDLAAGAAPLDGAVVVLSACSSGRSGEHSPEPVGLVSTCLAAGASGVVAALWPVDDEVTLELMTHFYRALATGVAPATALRRARREVARSYPHPYFWGAFRFVGRSARDA